MGYAKTFFSLFKLAAWCCSNLVLDLSAVSKCIKIAFHSVVGSKPINKNKEMTQWRVWDILHFRIHITHPQPLHTHSFKNGLEQDLKKKKCKMFLSCGYDVLGSLQKRETCPMITIQRQRNCSPCKPYLITIVPEFSMSFQVLFIPQMREPVRVVIWVSHLSLNIFCD